MGELLNASIMFFAPLIINRIGGKNALLLAGTIMSVRIIGSSFATSALEVVILKTLHMFEVPFLLVGCFKYITSQFEVRFSATIYLVCFCFFKQLAMILCLYWRAICMKASVSGRLSGAGSGGAGLHLNFRVHA